MQNQTYIKPQSFLAFAELYRKTGVSPARIFFPPAALMLITVELGSLSPFIDLSGQRLLEGGRFPLTFPFKLGAAAHAFILAVPREQRQVPGQPGSPNWTV